MRYILLILIAAILAGSAAAQPGQEVLQLRFIHNTGTTEFDSSFASLEINSSDTTEWIAVRDSSADYGGIYVSFWSQEDTVTGLVTAQWGLYDRTGKSTIPFSPVTSLDSLVSGTHTNAFNNPVTSPLHFRRPGGATRVRFIVTAGATIGQYGTGAARIPYVRAQAILPEP